MNLRLKLILNSARCGVIRPCLHPVEPAASMHRHATNELVFLLSTYPSMAADRRDAAALVAPSPAPARRRPSPGPARWPVVLASASAASTPSWATLPVRKTGPNDHRPASGVSSTRMLRKSIVHDACALSTSPPSTPLTCEAVSPDSSTVTAILGSSTDVPSTVTVTSGHSTTPRVVEPPAPATPWMDLARRYRGARRQSARTAMMQRHHYRDASPRRFR